MKKGFRQSRRNNGSLTAPDFVGQHLWPPSDAATSKLCNQLS